MSIAWKPLRPAPLQCLGWLAAFALVCGPGPWACDRGDTEKADEKAKADDGGPAKAAEDAVDEAVAEATKEAGAEHLFDPEDKTIRKRACEFLTPELVSGLFGVPAGELKQTKVMGCSYTWRKDGQLLAVSLPMIRVHKTSESAATWLANATATRSEEQAAAEVDMVKEKVKDRKEVDTAVKKQAAVNLADLAKMGTPDGGYSYEDLPGLGDEARISNTDGGIWVRLGNLTFQVYAYKGPAKPKPKLDPKNPQAMAAEAVEIQKKWMADTVDQRKADAKKLAPAVVQAIVGR